MMLPCSLSRLSLEEGIAEDAEGGRIGGELLDDEIVVLAGIDIGAVFADRVWQAALRFLSCRWRRFPETAWQPVSMTSSRNASRVPEVGGGPRTSIFSAGKRRD